MTTTRSQSKLKLQHGQEMYAHRLENPNFLVRKRESERRRRKKQKNDLIQKSLMIENLAQRVAILENKERDYILQIDGLKKQLQWKDQHIRDLSTERTAAFAVASQYKNMPTPTVGFSIDELMKDTKAVRDLTGISLENFEEISKRIHAIKNAMPLDLKKRYCSQTKLDDNKKLYLTLYWLRHYPKNRVLHWQFKIARSTLTKYLRRTLALLFLAIEDIIRWPSDREIEDELYHWNIFLPGSWKDMIFVIDGTEIKIHRPSIKEIQRKCFSTKHKQAMVNVLVITKLNGEAVYVSQAVATPSDQRVWNILQLRKRFVKRHFGLITDGGFTPNPKAGYKKIKAVRPIRKPKGGDLDQAQKDFNKTVAELRVVVENRFSRAKNWMVLSGTYRHHSLIRSDAIPLDLVIQAVFRLSELDIKQVPLRSLYWVPPCRRDDLMLDLLPNELF